MNIDEWAGTEYPERIIADAVAWLGFLDGFVDTRALQGEDSTTEILEQSIHKLNEAKRLEFFEWLSEDAKHQYVFADCCEMWAKTACLHSLKSSLQQSNIHLFPKQKPRSNGLKISSLVGESYPQTNAAPVWAYNLVISLIVLGLSLPAIY
jgi:hypothetical protein